MNVTCYTCSTHHTGCQTVGGRRDVAPEDGLRMLLRWSDSSLHRTVKLHDHPQLLARTDLSTGRWE